MNAYVTHNCRSGGTCGPLVEVQYQCSYGTTAKN